MKTKIYVLCQPDGEIRYIGKTSKSLAVRLSSHLSDSRQDVNNHRCNWIRSILSAGHLPAISLIGEVEGDGCQEEIAWINYGRQEGWRLVNETKGGEGALGCIFSDERIRKMSLAKKGKPSPRRGCILSEATRRKISEAGKGRKLSAEQCRKMSEANKGRIHSEESKRKIGLAHKGTHHSEEARQKMSESHKGEKHPNYGKHRSEETRHRIGEANRGRIASEETRRKISEATYRQFATKGHPRKGCHLSNEARQKMSEITKKFMTPECRKKISDGLKRYFQSKREI